VEKNAKFHSSLLKASLCTVSSVICKGKNSRYFY
jgi:hypothetical protein